MCNCKGLCKPHYMRPLICRIYPFIPKVSFDGECDGFLYASLFDVIYNDTNHPCTLTRENKEEIFEVLREKLKPLLTEPKLVFAFKVLEILYFNLLEKLDLTKDINTLNKKLEFLLLSRKAWRSKEFKQDITQAYEEITKKIWRIFMKTYAIEEFEVFLKTQTKKAKNILIHSSIANLGIPTKNGRKIQPQNIMDYYLEILFKCESEVLMPSFNYSFTKNAFADLRTLPSEVGSLTESYRRITKYRSIHPMFSFCSNNGKSIDESAEYNPFLGNCVYQRLLESNALMVFLGIDIRVCTFMVFLEASFWVKYRYFKPFFGKVIDMRGILHEGEFYHFCLPLNGEIKVDYSNIFKILLSLGVIKTQQIGASFIYYFNTEDFSKVVKKELTKNPYLLLKAPPKRFWTFKNGKDVMLESHLCHKD